MPQFAKPQCGGCVGVKKVAVVALSYGLHKKSQKAKLSQ